MYFGVATQLQFPSQNALLERLPDDPSLPSLTADSTFLTLFKRHAGLPTDSQWTEADYSLALYIDSAEEWIDEYVSVPYRPHTYRLSCSTSWWESQGTPDQAIDFRGGSFSCIRLPRGPVTASPTITYTDDNAVTTTLVSPDDFVVVGGLRKCPQVIFNRIQIMPLIFTVPYPYIVTWTTANNASLNRQKLAILQLASYYYKNPEAMGQSEPQPSAAFWNLIDSLKGSFL